MPDEQAADVVTWRYRLTLGLFALVSAALVIWFQRHIEPFVTETLIVGSTMSLWGLWKLVWSKWEDAGGDSGKDVTRRFLGGPRALNALLFAALIVALLHLFTGSIYLRFGGARANEDSFRVQVLEKGVTVLGPYEMHPGDTFGGPRIPNWHTRDLVYEIVDPRGFQPLPHTMHWWDAEDIEVPGSFERRSLHVIAFAPDKLLYMDLPRVGETNGERYYLTVRARGKSWTLPDYYAQLVLAGAAREDLPGKKGVTEDARLRDQIHDHFTQEPPIAAALLTADLAPLGTVEFGSAEKVEVEVGVWTRDGDRLVPTPEFKCAVAAPTADKPETVVIGKTRTEACR